MGQWPSNGGRSVGLRVASPPENTTCPVLRGKNQDVHNILGDRRNAHCFDNGMSFNIK